MPILFNGFRMELLEFSKWARVTDPHGAPLRLRVERPLGYKHAKYIMRLALVTNFDDIGDGKGGCWEDHGYQWYAGI